MTEAEINGDRVVLHLIRDITRRKRQEQSQQLLHALDERILTNQPVEEILAFAATELVRIFDLPLVWIGTNEADGTMRVLASSGPARSFLTGALFRWDQGGNGDAVRTGRPHTLDLTDPRRGKRATRARAAGLHHALAVPLKVNEQVVGAVTLYNAGPAPFEPDTIAEIQGLAGQIGVGLLTARHQQLIQLQSTALAAAANAVLITNRDGLIQWVNPAFTALTGFSPEEVYGQRPSLLSSGRHNRLFYKQMWETILAGEVWHGQVNNQRRDGTPYVEEMTITPVKGLSGEVTHFVAIKQDITERRRQEERIVFMATHDCLTGLANRSGLNDRLERAVKRGRRGKTSALVLLDLDNFKLVNDTVGHPAGDQLLVNMARIMLETVRQVDSVARLGGDEFGILLEDVTVAEAREVSERLRAAVDGYRFHWGGHVFALTASMGIAMIDGTHSADEALALSDAALYEAKHHGKNRVAVRSGTDEKDENLAAARWMTRIKDAIAAERFEVHYQPVTCLKTGEPWHMEALVRMRDECGQILSPGQFIPIAERFGFMPDIDRYVIRHAICTPARRPGLQMFINLSGLTLSDSSLSGFIRRVLQETGVEPNRVCFEVTETTALLNLAHTQELMREIKTLGCRFALDDFGSGFASFAYLRSLPVDYIKLDGSFTYDLDSNSTNLALAKAVVDIAHVLGKAVIAERVERRSDARALEELGVEYGQGFLWGHPSPLQTS